MSIHGFKANAFCHVIAFVSGIFWAGFYAEPTFAQMRVPPVGGVSSGVVSTVESNGDIILEDGARIDFWGLEILDKIELERLLIGRVIVCSVIGEQDNIFVSDCVIYAKRHDPPLISRDLFRLDLFPWLQEFGIAEAKCSKADISLGSTPHARGLFYKCDAGADPSRSARFLKIE